MTKTKKIVAAATLSLVTAVGTVGVSAVLAEPAIADPKPCC